MTWPADLSLAGNAGLVLLLGKIDERTERTEDVVKKIEDRLIQGDKRMDRSDQKIDALASDVAALKASGLQPAAKSPGRISLATAAMTGIAPLKEWMLGALVILLGLKGVISPADVKALVFEYLK